MELIINKLNPIFDFSNEVFWNREFVKLSMDFMMKRPHHVKQIEMFKTTFGRQKICKLLGSENRRFYIWTFQSAEFPESFLYAMVHNVAGTTYEYPHKTRKDQHLKIVKEVQKRILKQYI